MALGLEGNGLTGRRGHSGSGRSRLPVHAHMCGSRIARLPGRRKAFLAGLACLPVGRSRTFLRAPGRHVLRVGIRDLLLCVLVARHCRSLRTPAAPRHRQPRHTPLGQHPSSGRGSPGIQRREDFLELLV